MDFRSPARRRNKKAERNGRVQYPGICRGRGYLDQTSKINIFVNRRMDAFFGWSLVRAGHGGLLPKRRSREPCPLARVWRKYIPDSEWDITPRSVSQFPRTPHRPLCVYMGGDLCAKAGVDTDLTHTMGGKFVVFGCSARYSGGLGGMALWNDYVKSLNK